jgi:CRP-like cAMP-binding protein
MSFAGQTTATRASFPLASMPLTGRVQPDDSLSAMQAIGQQAHFNRDATIFSDGDDALYSYKVVSGTVRLCKLMSDGRRQIAEFLQAGDFFGFEWQESYTLTAEALEDVVVVRFPRSRLNRLGEERRDVQRQLMSLLSRDLCAAQNHLLLLGRQTAKERVASFLLSLATRSQARSGSTLDIPMCRQDIADYLGLTIETVCRAISELKRARLIGVPNRWQIVVNNIPALREIAGGDA